MNPGSFIERIKPHSMAIWGFAMPYITTIFVVLIVNLLPYETIKLKWSHAGILPLLPLVGWFVGSVLVGIHNVNRHKKLQRSHPIADFMFPFLWDCYTAIFCLDLFFYVDSLYIWGSKTLILPEQRILKLKTKDECFDRDFSRIPSRIN